MGNFIPFTLDFTKNSIEWIKKWIIGNNQEQVAMTKNLKFQYRYKIHNAQLNRSLFTRNYFGLKVPYSVMIPKFLNAI